MNWGDELAGLNAASGLPGSDKTMGLGSIIVGAGKMIGAGIRGKDLPTPVVGADIGGSMPDLSGVQPGPEAGDQETQNRYQAGLEKERAANEAARAAHPTAYFAGELGGGLATLPFAPELAPFKVAKTAPLVTKTLKTGANLATAGAGYGAVAGAGGAEEGNRIQGAVQGAEMGAIAAPVLGGAFKAVGAGANYLGRTVGASFTPDRLAMRAIQDALEADGTNLQQAIIRLRQAQAQGQNLTLADIAGANTRSLASSASRYPGPAKQKIRASTSVSVSRLGRRSARPTKEAISGHLARSEECVPSRSLRRLSGIRTPSGIRSFRNYRLVRSSSRPSRMLRASRPTKGAH
jgi:hypothetical protein